MNDEVIQIPGHIFGPPVPHIAFYYGEQYLGEARGHPSDIPAARARLEKMMELKMFWPEADFRHHLLCSGKASARLYCGSISVQLGQNGASLEPEVELKKEEPMLPDGFSKERPVDSRAYVMMLVLSADRKRAVGLLKQKGPSFLIGKITFPGGKVEAGELLEAAASRELVEEVGVAVAPDDWKFLAASRDMAVFTAVGDVEAARTMEAEPVFVFDVAAQLEMAQTTPSMFSRDFLVLLKAAISR